MHVKGQSGPKNGGTQTDRRVGLILNLQSLISVKLTQDIYSVLRPFQDYLSSYDLDQFLGGTKRDYPERERERERERESFKKEILTSLTFVRCGARSHNGPSGETIEW